VRRGPSPVLTNCFDLTLSDPLHPAQAVMRLENLFRMTVAEEEFALRLETFTERGRRLDLPDSESGPYRVLAIGESPGQSHRRR